ncbi:MAG: hypothetical protein WCP01_09695 [Methylococcaceae bacterium]
MAALKQVRLEDRQQTVEDADRNVISIACLKNRKFNLDFWKGLLTT